MNWTFLLLAGLHEIGWTVHFLVAEMALPGRLAN